MGQSLCDLQRIAQRVLESQRSVLLNHVAKVRALDELEDDEIPAVILADVVDAGDVGVIEPGGILGLVAEAANGLFIGAIAQTAP